MSSRDALARALFAEAIRDLHPWRLCASAGGPEVGTEELVEELEQGLGADPDHIGLLHFYIVHAIRGFWHFSRGMAFVGKRHLGQAQDEMPCSEPPPWFYPAPGKPWRAAAAAWLRH